ncbi:MAG: hypothetical protein NTZ87_01810 [Candidatus Nomurabacteria bacterium]|nr:hypothetical protein [Candidatus Nomurabacteria bacterium]
MSTNYIGGYWILSVLPIWATAFILYMMTMGVIFILRDRYEGLFYNTSYSAMIGDGALLVVVLMAAGILQRGETLIPTLLQSGRNHYVVAVWGFSFGVLCWWLSSDPKQWADIWHNLVIVPLLFYLGIILLPVIFKNGTRAEVVATLFFIVIWIALVGYDKVTQRLNQRECYDLGRHLDEIKLEKDQDHQFWR